MKMLHRLGLVLLILLTGCAHNAMRGTMAMKVNNEEGHVCMGDGEVKAGDRVALFKNVCTSPKGAQGGGSAGCEKVKLGEGSVIRTLNEHYSVVKVNPGVSFEEGTMVEKI